MADSNTLLMLVGAATPPGRLAAAIDYAAEAARAEDDGHRGRYPEPRRYRDRHLRRARARCLWRGDAAGRGAHIRRRRGADRPRRSIARAIPGVLKNLLDITPVEALQNKPVGILAMGGSPHHYLAVDTQLRAVLGWFGALVAPTSVYVTGGDFKDGRLASEGARADLAALTGTLIALAGGSTRRRSARSRSPHGSPDANWFLRRHALAVVELVEGGLVGGADRVAADFQGRGQLRVGEAERLGGDHEAAHPLGRLQVAVDPGDDVAQRLVEAGIVRQRRRGRRQPRARWHRRRRNRGRGR